MNIPHTSTPSRQRQGFTLIEVLVAVVVLATGLLALTALQTALMRNSADAKTTSQVAVFAQGLLERARVSDFTAVNAPLATVAELTAAAQAAGVSALTETTTVTHVVGAGNTFLRPGDAGYPAALAAAASQPNSAQFKEVNIRLSWTDATGAARNFSMSTVISPLSVRFSDPLVLRPLTGTVAGPIVRRPLSATVSDGMIPIALGDGSETAATNPRPELVGKKQDTWVHDTRFEVLTYAAGSDGGVDIAEIQKRVETAVIGCHCRNSTAGYPSGVVGSFLQAAAYRPTYWDGKKYVEPEKAAYAVTSGPKPSTVQSAICDVCCRDHRDPVGTSGAKFDPRRSVHDHFRINAQGEFVAAGSGEDYIEACRVIRVNGMWRVAADMFNEHFNLLETANAAASPLPSSTGVTNYENFVKGYIDARYTTGSEVSYNNQLPSSTLDALVLFNSLNDPAEITVDTGTVPKWLHARGLYIDYLEQPAVDHLQKVKSECSPANMSTCVLRALPFTTINLTEIAFWRSSNTQVITVTNADFGGSLSQTDPVKGKVTLGTAANPGVTAQAQSTIGASNSGLAIFQRVDPADAAATLEDAQDFRVAGGASPPSSDGGSFFVNLLGPVVDTLSAANPASIGFTLPPLSLRSCNPNAGNFSAYTCWTTTGQELGQALKLTVGNYNRTAEKSVPNVCRNPSQHTTPMPYRIVYDILSTTPSGTMTVFNNNAVGLVPTGEYTEIQLSQVNRDDTIEVQFSNPTYLCPANYYFAGQSEQAANCSGQGNNAKPTWSTTYVTCPAGLVP